MTSLLKTTRRTRKAYADLAPYAQPHRRHFYHGLAATLLLVAARLAFPWPLRGLMDIALRRSANTRTGFVRNIVPPGVDPMFWLIGCFIAIVLVWGAAEARQRAAFARFTNGLASDARTAGLQRLPLAPAADPGHVLTTLTSDAGRVKSGLKSILVATTRNATFFLGVTVIVAFIDLWVGMLFLAGGLCTLLVAAAGGWAASGPARRSRRREADLSRELFHYLTGETPDRPKRTSSGSSSKVVRIEGRTTFAIHLVLAATTCGILLLTISHARAGRLSPGSVFTVIVYVLLMHNKTVGFGRSVARGGRLLPSAERLGRAAGARKTGGARTAASANPADLQADPTPEGDCPRLG